jgi:hypothetical protein
MNAGLLLTLLRRAGVSKTILAGLALYLVAIGAIGPETLFGQWLPRVFDIRIRIYGLILGPKEVLATILAGIVVWGRLGAKGPLWIGRVVDAVLDQVAGASPAVAATEELAGRTILTPAPAFPTSPPPCPEAMLDNVMPVASPLASPAGLAALLLPDAVSQAIPSDPPAETTAETLASRPRRAT